MMKIAFQKGDLIIGAYGKESEYATINAESPVLYGHNLSRPIYP
jgi:hypothetical protein